MSLNAAVWVALGGAASSAVSAVLALRRAAHLRGERSLSPPSGGGDQEASTPRVKLAPIAGQRGSETEESLVLSLVEERLRPPEPSQDVRFEDLVERLRTEGLD
jgi:hypothetical protein